MATKSETLRDPPPTHAQQGIQDSTIDYYDIMVIGKTGMGKSTTADKLLVANPDGRDYQEAEYSEPVADGNHVNVEDLCIWLLSDAPDELTRVKTRLKNIVFFRGLRDPHTEINEFHSDEQTNNGATPNFELISNESTNMRILDVPGFFGEGGAGTSAAASAGEKASNSVNTALRRMLNILQIQTAMQMKFRRILYFLPVHGALRRSDSYLETELTTLAKYLGKAIFECMVVIVTMPAEAYDGGNHIVFSEKARRTTRNNFDAVLSRALPNESDIPKPPILFISMMDSCEKILSNVKDAPVARDPITLQFDSLICARCGSKTVVVHKERVAVYYDELETSTIPYNESTCHPLFIPRYTSIARFFRGIVYDISFRNLCQNYLDEMCVECNKAPGSYGCTIVKTAYELKGEQMMVDHTSNTSEPIKLEDDPIQAPQSNPTISVQTRSFAMSPEHSNTTSSGVRCRATNMDSDPPSDRMYTESKGT